MESEIQNNSSFHSGHRRVSLPKAKTHMGGGFLWLLFQYNGVGVRRSVHWGKPNVSSTARRSPVSRVLSLQFKFELPAPISRCCPLVFVSISFCALHYQVVWKLIA